MTEVKRRTTAITEIRNKTKSTSFQATNIEFCCLQTRKILELIALGSLIANKRHFEEQKIKFEKFWHAELILKDIERLNPNFYPSPIKENPHSNPTIKMDWQELKEGYLTKEDFLKVYEKCGKIMHADNPFGSKTDLDYYEKQIDIWINKIIRLLNSHLIKLVDDTNLYLIHMQEERDDKVHVYTFELVGPK
ncbi:MAG: hypothetical protein WA440_03365 [Ignavibacteriaceae bacterium]